jgi:hypothetical protein
MDVSRLRRGEQIAGISGIVLLLVMFIFDWFTYELSGGVAALGGLDASEGGNAWRTMEIIRFILLITALCGIALAAVTASESNVSMPVALSAITAGLGILAVVLVLFRIISPPDGGAGDLVDVGRSIGVFLGLIASAGVAYGGFLAMQEEGTSFGAQADRLGDRGDNPPPPPPPPAAGPPAGGPPAGGPPSA